MIYLKGSGGSRSVPLAEGKVTDIKIEVTSEDNTIKNYFVHVKRLSGNDATLGTLVISPGILEPEFEHDTYQYTCKCIIQNNFAVIVFP